MSSIRHIVRAEKFGWIMLLAGLLAACSHTAPQRPSQRMGETPKGDSTQLALMEMNQQLALAADKQLTRLAQEQTEPYALYVSNTWIHILDRGDEDSFSPIPGEEWTVHMRIYDLEEHLLEDSEAAYHIGKQELPLAVEANIEEWYHGTRARMLVPWYAAFGMKGTDRIPPYENVIIEIEIR